MSTRKRDILLLVCIAVVVAIAIGFTMTQVPVELDIGKVDPTTYTSVDDFGYNYELIVYNEKDEFANLLVYMPEQNDLVWRQRDIEGTVELIYTRYEGDHYVISFKPGSFDGKVSTSFALSELEEEHDHGPEETISEEPLYIIEVSNNEDGSHNYQITCGKFTDHYIPASE